MFPLFVNSRCVNGFIISAGVILTRINQKRIKIIQDTNIFSEPSRTASIRISISYTVDAVGEVFWVIHRLILGTQLQENVEINLISGAFLF